MENTKKELIGIIAANNIRFSPYIFFYTKILDQLDVRYELIYPNRNHLSDTYYGITYSLPWDSKKSSLLNYIKYAKNVEKIIVKKKYSKLIVLTSVIASIMSIWLSKHYRGRYIIDIRDYTYEHIIPYAMLERIALKSAALRILSSYKFKSFLPDEDYLICHNFHAEKENISIEWKKKSGIIVIGYIGSVAYSKNVIKLIKHVMQNEKFCFYIYGSGPEQDVIEKAVVSARCERIKYFGPYVPNEKEKLIKGVDVLFNVYGNDSKLLTCALSNKLYDGMAYRKIILNSPGTYMQEMSGICGYSIDLDYSNCLDDFYGYYRQLNEKQVTDFQNESIKKYINENNITENKIAHFLLS